MSLFKFEFVVYYSSGVYVDLVHKNLCRPVYILPGKIVFSSPLYSSATMSKPLLDMVISSPSAIYPWQYFCVCIL